MVIIPEVDVLTKWVKAEKNREDWGKIKSCCKYQKVMIVYQLLVKGLTVLHICYVDPAVIYIFPQKVIIEIYNNMLNAWQYKNTKLFLIHEI